MKPRQVYYLTKTEAEANMCVTALPLTVNCTGLEYYYAPFRYRTQRHDNTLVYVLSGQLDFTLGNIDISLFSGQFIIIPPGTPISFGTDKELLAYYWLQFSGSMAQQLLSEMSAAPNTPYEIGICKDACTAFEDIFHEFLANDKFFAASCAAKLTHLFICLFRKLSLAKKELLRSISYIRGHYNEPLSVEALAKMECTSPSHYRAEFKRVTGHAPKDYISLQRLNAACFYLLHTDYAVCEIANLIGFDDQLYFSRFFKQKTGMSPLAYRRLNKAKTGGKG